MRWPGWFRDTEITYDLVRSAAEGCKRPREQLFSLLVPLFRRQARVACEKYGISADEEMVEDLVQEMAVHLLADDARRIKVWLSDPKAPFEHFAAVVAANRLRGLVSDLARSQRRELHPIAESLGYVDSSADHDSEVIGCVQRCLDILPPDESRILVLRYCEGMSSSRIAAREGMTREQVYRLTHRAKEHLKELLTREIGGDIP